MVSEKACETLSEQLLVFAFDGVFEGAFDGIFEGAFALEFGSSDLDAGSPLSKRVDKAGPLFEFDFLGNLENKELLG